MKYLIITLSLYICTFLLFAVLHVYLPERYDVVYFTIGATPMTALGGWLSGIIAKQKGEI